MHRHGLIVSFVLALALGLASPASGKPQPRPTPVSPPAGQKPASDIEVSVILVSGEMIRYASEVRQVHLVLDGQGKLSVVHLVLAKGGETDTHEWYSMDNIAGFSYRFFELTGKGKVTVVRLAPVPAEREYPDKVPALRPENYL